MAINVSEGGTFVPHPEGQFQAVCVDVIEAIAVPTEYGPKNKIRLVWQTTEMMENGKPFICSRNFNASLATKSILRPFIEAWRGKAFTKDELKSFDLEKLLGINALISVVHVDKNERTYDNVTTAMKLMKGMAPIAAVDYVRRKDRPAQDGYSSPPATPTRASATMPSLETVPPALDDDNDDDLPF